MKAAVTDPSKCLGTTDIFFSKATLEDTANVKKLLWHCTHFLPLPFAITFSCCLSIRIHSLGLSCTYFNVSEYKSK